MPSRTLIGAALLCLLPVAVISIRLPERIQTIRTQERQQPAEYDDFGDDLYDFPDRLDNIASDPDETCQVDDLLAVSENVSTYASGRIQPGSSVKLTCKPGYLPPVGTYHIASIKCNNKQWEGKLVCFKACTNADLATAIMAPKDKDGSTNPEGLMGVTCTAVSTGTFTGNARCGMDGKWSIPERCKHCETADILRRKPGVVLSVIGNVAQGSKVQMACPKGTSAYPATDATAVCTYGGVWELSAIECK